MPEYPKCSCQSATPRRIFPRSAALVNLDLLRDLPKTHSFKHFLYFRPSIFTFLPLIDFCQISPLWTLDFSWQNSKYLIYLVMKPLIPIYFSIYINFSALIMDLVKLPFSSTSKLGLHGKLRGSWYSWLKSTYILNLKNNNKIKSLSIQYSCH